MKASIKFREDQTPKFRAKIPLNILGFPFQSGLESGDTKELCLSFSTFFESGPLLKLSYRPNHPFNPFALGLKTGIGHLGSPIAAPLTIAAEFNLLSRGNPAFFLHFRPQIGDFTIKRSLQSQLALHSTDAAADTGKKVNGLFAAGKVIESVCSGVEVSATTAMPLRDRAALKLRWCVRFPAEEIGDRTAEISFRRMPCLLLNKIAIEHVALKRELQQKPDVAETCLAVTKELEALQTESGLVRRGVDELRSEKFCLATGVHDSGEVNEVAKSGGKKLNRGQKPSDLVTLGNVTK